MAIVRTYLCGDCGEKFDRLHFDRSEPPPECPTCKALSARQAPSGFSIGGNAAKAGDIAQDILEKDYGMTDIKDRLREGDIAMPSIAPSLQPAVKSYWNPPGGIIASAKQGAQAAAAEGRNPISMLQKVNKSRGASAARVLCKPVNRVN